MQRFPVMRYLGFSSGTRGRRAARSTPRTGFLALAALLLPAALGSCESVSVTALDIASVEVSPAEESILPGGRLQLSATVRDAGGRSLPDRPISWASEDESVATVGADGLVTAHRAGVVRIVASAGSAQGSATLTVREVEDPQEPEPERDESESEDDGSGDDDGDEGTGDDAGDDDRDETGGSARVTSIDYNATGGPDDRRHLRITVRVEDGGGRRVGGASVSVRTTNVDTGERWDLSGSTSGDGTVVLSINHHPEGCYETVVREVVTDGLRWDGETPGNRHCR